ncbi:hypothetical protein CROQUDRAFT_626766 [Cronartium quercuum f. sp. fusiforme G11]|uniref:Uncharacterized protein n=1 Tax=Cronartium quercuum f. sp. fusiforme G11 TaxID=708437 RepID=A0A9P6NRF2_9BASI|nr:hypothetical protein CROQUDRAFT_626766 [Cronartium quercuum f. sp. fusiforme G11]
MKRESAQTWPYGCRKLLARFSLGIQYRPKVGFETGASPTRVDRNGSLVDEMGGPRWGRELPDRASKVESGIGHREPNGEGLQLGAHDLHISSSREPTVRVRRANKPGELGRELGRSMLAVISKGRPPARR